MFSRAGLAQPANLSASAFETPGQTQPFADFPFSDSIAPSPFPDTFGQADASIQGDPSLLAEDASDELQKLGSIPEKTAQIDLNRYRLPLYEQMARVLLGPHLNGIGAIKGADASRNGESAANSAHKASDQATRQGTIQGKTTNPSTHSSPVREEPWFAPLVKPAFVISKRFFLPSNKKTPTHSGPGTNFIDELQLEPGIPGDVKPFAEK